MYKLFILNQTLLVYVAAKIAGVKTTISSRRDLGDLKKKRQILLNKLINPSINSFISVCNKVKEKLIEVENIPSEKIITLYNGIDLINYTIDNHSKSKARKKIGINTDKFVVGIACILRPEKDVKMFLKAISLVQKQIRNLFVLIVGDGESKTDLVEFTRKANLTENTLFTGYVNDIRDYIKTMDVVCLTPIKNEGFSNVILEEMALRQANNSYRCRRKCRIGNRWSKRIHRKTR